MPMADRRARDGRFSAEPRVSGESQRWLRRAMVCSNLTILFPTQSRNGRATRANRRSPSGSYSASPMVSKAVRGCSAPWSEIVVLGQGSYHGRQIVPAARLREAFAGSAANPSYGLTFWLNRQAPNEREADMERMIDLPWQSAEWTGVCICKDAPADMVVALGSHYQRLFIIPSLKAIIVRQGLEARFSDAHFLRLVLGRIQ